jgi:hypothetical protein
MTRRTRLRCPHCMTRLKPDCLVGKRPAPWGPLPTAAELTEARPVTGSRDPAAQQAEIKAMEARWRERAKAIERTLARRGGGAHAL